MKQQSENSRVSGATKPSLNSKYSRHSGHSRATSTILNQPIVPLNFKRDFAMGVEDVMMDKNILAQPSQFNAPRITLKPNYQRYNAPKEPGQPELFKRNCEGQDKWDKVHYDYYGRKIIKLHDDERHHHNNTIAEHFYHEFKPNRQRQTLMHPLFRKQESTNYHTLQPIQPKTTRNSNNCDLFSNASRHSRASSAVRRPAKGKRVGINGIVEQYNTPQPNRRIPDQKRYASVTLDDIRSQASGNTNQLNTQKYQVIKAMLKNEQRANDMIKNKIKALSTQLHHGHKATIGLQSHLAEQVKA